VTSEFFGSPNLHVEAKGIVKAEPPDAAVTADQELGYIPCRRKEQY
jgi:hypothetical protein